MYIICVYDVQEKRVQKVHKLLKQYLHWKQNSVFEGELTNALFHQLTTDLQKITDTTTDSIIFYILPSEKNLKRFLIGVDKNSTSFIL